jgi:hypothetical protein
VKFNPDNVKALGFHVFGDEKKLVIRMNNGKRIDIDIAKNKIELYTKRNESKEQYNTATV